MTKAGDFDQGEAGEGPEEVARRKEREVPGEDTVRGNVGNESMREKIELKQQGKDEVEIKGGKSVLPVGERKG